MDNLVLAALLLIGLGLIALSDNWRARLAGAALFLLVLLRIKPKEPEPTPEPIKPTPIESTPNETIHEMDDASASQPADTLSAEQLRDWANKP